MRLYICWSHALCDLCAGDRPVRQVVSECPYREFGCRVAPYMFFVPHHEQGRVKCRTCEHIYRRRHRAPRFRRRVWTVVRRCPRVPPRLCYCGPCSRAWIGTDKFPVCVECRQTALTGITAIIPVVAPLLIEDRDTRMRWGQIVHARDPRTDHAATRLALAPQIARGVLRAVVIDDVIDIISAYMHAGPELIAGVGVSEPFMITHTRECEDIDDYCERCRIRAPCPCSTMPEFDDTDSDSDHDSEYDIVDDYGIPYRPRRTRTIYDIDYGSGSDSDSDSGYRRHRTTRQW